MSAPRDLAVELLDVVNGNRSDLARAKSVFDHVDDAGVVRRGGKTEARQMFFAKAGAEIAHVRSVGIEPLLGDWIAALVDFGFELARFDASGGQRPFAIASNGEAAL